MDVGNLISGFSAFSKPSLYIWKFLAHILLKPGFKDFEHNLVLRRGSGKELPANARDVRDASSVPELGRSLEEGMATHSNILAWKIPWSEKSDGLQSMGSHRVRHD